MLTNIDGFQISEVTPVDDGSLVTTLFDATGNNVGTVRRLTDGTVTADVETLPSDTGGFDWSGILRRVTGFLDDVADNARKTADETTRISRGIKGAATGAQAAYNAPIDWKPYAIAGAAVVAAVAIAVAASGSSRRGR